MLHCHSPEPMVDQRGLSNPSPGNYRDDIYIFVCPCVIQESDILLSTKNIASSNRQSGYGNVLRVGSCWQLASYQVGIFFGRLPHALISNRAAFLDSARYCRQRLEKLGRRLKTPPGIFIEQHFEEADDRLRNPLEFLKRQGSVLMLRHYSGGYPERHLTCQHLPERNTQRVEIRTDIHLSPVACSGLANSGVPAKAPLAEIVVCAPASSITSATPRSMILTLTAPSSSKLTMILLGLMSR